jgi:cytochrome c553
MTQNPIVLNELSPPIKVLFTGYLCTVGIGYMFALIQILFTHGMADGKFGLSVDDIVYSYYGNRSGTVLEQQLNGSMKENAPEQERFKIMEWVRSGADAEAYKDDGIEKIIQTRCVMCHNKDASALPDFSSLEGLKPYTAQDTGATFASLTRVSHVHMFGISFIFMFVGLIFSFSETITNQYKCIAIGMPYVFLVADILSWWLTKIHPMFAWLVILAGMGMAISFIFMWVISLLEMWLFKPVFINRLDSSYLKWRDSTEASAVDKLLLLVKALPSKIRPVTVLIIDLWLQHAWPVIIGLFKK